MDGAAFRSIGTCNLIQNMFQENSNMFDLSIGLD